MSYPPSPPPSAPTGMVLVPVAFLRALLHDSTCPVEPCVNVERDVTSQAPAAAEDALPWCDSPDHGMSFTELREHFLQIVMK